MIMMMILILIIIHVTNEMEKKRTGDTYQVTKTRKTA